MARIIAAGTAGPGISEAHLDALDADILRFADRLTRITLLGMEKALSGIPETTRRKIGLVAGIDAGAYPSIATSLGRMVREGYRAASPQEFKLTTANIAPALASIHFGLKGPSTTISSGPLSGLTAVGMAAEWVDAGRAPMMLAGAAVSTGRPVGELAGWAGLPEPLEASAFVLLAAEGTGPEVGPFFQQRTGPEGLEGFLRETAEATRPTTLLVHPGRETMPELPGGLPATDLRETPGELLETTGPFAAATLAASPASRILILQQSPDGRRAAALLATTD